MINSVNHLACTGCGMCERVCPADLFRMVDGKMTVVYPVDCCNCMQCKYVCPSDALSFDTLEPEKLDMSLEWEKIKVLMGAVNYASK